MQQQRECRLLQLCSTHGVQGASRWHTSCSPGEGPRFLTVLLRCGRLTAHQIAAQPAGELWYTCRCPTHLKLLVAQRALAVLADVVHIDAGVLQERR